jgi:hypothetical protein
LKNYGNLSIFDDGLGSNATFNQNYNLQKEQQFTFTSAQTKTFNNPCAETFDN